MQLHAAMVRIVLIRRSNYEIVVHQFCELDIASEGEVGSILEGEESAFRTFRGREIDPIVFAPHVAIHSNYRVV